MPALRLFIVAMLLTGSCAIAGELEADLATGDKLLKDRLPLEVGFFKTTYMQMTMPDGSGGYGVVTLTAENRDGSIVFKYKTEGMIKLRRIRANNSCTAVLDRTFRPLEYTCDQTMQEADGAARASSLSAKISLDGKIQAAETTDGQTTQEEYCIENVGFVWPAGEVLKFLKLGGVESFALRELNPNGQPAPPKLDAQGKFLPGGRTYEPVTFQFSVSRKEDGSYRIGGRRTGKPMEVRYEYDRSGELVSFLTFAVGSDGTSKQLAEWKVTTKEDIEKLKASLER